MAEDMIFSERTRANFRSLDDSIGIYQEHYLDELVELTRAKGIPLVILNIPQSTERHSSTVLEREDWSKRFGTGIPLVGVPPSVLFSGLDDTGIDKLFLTRRISIPTETSSSPEPSLLRSWRSTTGMRSKISEVILVTLLIILCLAACALVVLIPYRSLDTGLVYRDF
jgi:hypothetical protein